MTTTSGLLTEMLSNGVRRSFQFSRAARPPVAVERLSPYTRGIGDGAACTHELEPLDRPERTARGRFDNGLSANQHRAVGARVGCALFVPNPSGRPATRPVCPILFARYRRGHHRPELRTRGSPSHAG